jgi:hypothetical protein
MEDIHLHLWTSEVIGTKHALQPTFECRINFNTTVNYTLHINVIEKRLLWIYYQLRLVCSDIISTFQSLSSSWQNHQCARCFWSHALCKISDISMCISWGPQGRNLCHIHCLLAGNWAITLPRTSLSSPCLGRQGANKCAFTGTTSLIVCVKCKCVCPEPKCIFSPNFYSSGNFLGHLVINFGHNFGHKWILTNVFGEFYFSIC